MSCSLAQVVYEAYGINGTAFLIECLTDNVNRSVSDVKSAVIKGGGKVTFQSNFQSQIWSTGSLTLADSGTGGIHSNSGRIQGAFCSTLCGKASCASTRASAKMRRAATVCIDYIFLQRMFKGRQIATFLKRILFADI